MAHEWVLFMKSVTKYRYIYVSYVCVCCVCVLPRTPRALAAGKPDPTHRYPIPRHGLPSNRTQPVANPSPPCCIEPWQVSKHDGTLLLSDLEAADDGEEEESESEEEEDDLRLSDLANKGQAARGEPLREGL